MPEPVELRVRGGERRRVAVAERDDGDARRRGRGSACPSLVDQPAAVAVDERDAEARVGREQRGRCATVRAGSRHGHRASRRRSYAGDAVARGGGRGARASGRSRPRALPPSSSAVACAASIESTTSPSRMKPSTSVRKSSRSAPSPSASAAAASSAFTFSGPVGDRRDHGDPPRRERVHDRRRARRERVADEPELGHALGAQADLVAEERDGERRRSRSRARG